jgi:hypothetical protein
MDFGAESEGEKKSNRIEGGSFKVLIGECGGIAARDNL